MHGDLCVPVTLCHHNQFPSKIILSKDQELLHLTWRALEGRHNVNRTYSSTTDTNHFCFHNVTESFRFLEYCEEGMMPCVKHSSFCCNWLEFVTRTCVIVNGSKYSWYICQSSCWMLSLVYFVLCFIPKIAGENFPPNTLPSDPSYSDLYFNGLLYVFNMS